MRRVGSIFALLFLAPGTAAADSEPPSLGLSPRLVERQEVVVETMLCDTVDQLEAILRARVEHGLQAGQQVYQALRATPNERREPTCLVAPYKLTLLDVAAEWQDVPTPEGSMATVYILYVLVNGNPYAILSPMPVEPEGLDV